MNERVEIDHDLMKRAKEAEFYETPLWAAERILDHELLTENVLDPCAGRGVLGEALEEAGYVPHEYDLNAWPDRRLGIITPFNFLDKGVRDDLKYLTNHPRGFSVMLNPPFSLTCEFIERSLDLGARKILMFQRFSFLESAGRRGFFEKLPPARVWLCGDRAHCWRGDIPEEDILDENGSVLAKGKKGRSSPTAHAWYVWEDGHKGSMSVHHLYRNR